MGALKQGVVIHVVTKNRYFAEKFMCDNFNEPNKILKSRDEFIYLYENGDEVRWLYPRESNRGYKCNILYYDNTVDAELLCNVFRPSVLSVETYLG